MNKKDIALTVGGVLATMVVAYLIYKMQQRDAAAAAASVQDDSEAAAVAAQQAQEAQYSAAWQAEQTFPQVTTPTITGAISTTDTPASVDTSAATATTGATGTTIDSTDIDTLLNNIIAGFAPSITSQGATPETVASMTIPTIAGVQASALTGIPLTAQDAAAEAAVPAITTSYSTLANFPSSMTTGSTVTSHPVTSHPIVTQGN